MAAAQMHSEGRLIQPVSDKSGPQGEVVPLQIENTLTHYDQGKMTSAGVKAAMPEGWSVDLRRGRYDYEVTSPSGNIHYVQP